MYDFLLVFYEVGFYILLLDVHCFFLFLMHVKAYIIFILNGHIFIDISDKILKNVTYL